MSLRARGALLARLAGRYARRHKGQTARAVLGLLIATTVLATGLGMGESIAASLEETALRTLGPVDVVLASSRPFDEALVPAAARAAGVQGAASVTLTGSVANEARELAEPFATVRGVGPGEREALGPLPGGAPEPRAGEVVLSRPLAERLRAQPGDRILLRVAPPGLSEDVDTEFIQMTGVSNAGIGHSLQVREGALGVGAEVSWSADAGTVTLEAVSPGGMAFANRSAASPLQLVIPGPVEPGEWTLRVRSDVPTAYVGGAGAAYLPATLGSAVVTLEARVAGVAEEEGRAALTGRPVALVPLADLQRALQMRGNATHAYFRVAGDPYEAVEAIRGALPDERIDDFDVRAQKADMLAEAEEAGAEITGFLVGMGAFTLLASVLLAFTLFSALVEERRAELGIARALGLTRGEVALAMTLEGALYAVAAALVGLALGLLVLVGLLAGIAAVAGDDAPIRFALHVSPRTLLVAFLVGALLPLATIGLASLRFARLDPARAIRGIPDDPKGRRSVGLLVAGALVAAGALLSLGPWSRLVGVPILLAGAAAGLAALGRPRWSALPAALAIAHVAWTLYTVDDFPEERGELDPILTLARGAVLALGLAALAVASPRPYVAVARRLSGGAERARAAFVSVRYLVARRRPAGLTMAMVALVVVIVTVMGTLFAVFSRTIPDEEAGYQVLGEAPLLVEGFPRPLPADLAAAVERADFLPRHVEFRQANVTRDGEPVDMEAGGRQFLGVTPEFADANEYELDGRADRYATDRDAWRAVARGEAVLFPDWALDLNGIEPGEVLRIQTALTPAREYVVAGGVDSEFVFQTFLAADDVRAMGFPTGTRVFVRVAEGADPDEVAHRLAARHADAGLTFTSIPEEVDRIAANAQALVLVFEAFLALGLFVGLAATGFLAQRAVRERMRDIGTLRALGYEEKDVRRLFVLESTLTAGLGLLIGTLVGLLVAHSIWWRAARDEVPFSPPWLLLAAFAAAVLLLAALASRGPARRAAQLAPAIAVRHVE